MSPAHGPSLLTWSRQRLPPLPAPQQLRGVALGPKRPRSLTASGRQYNPSWWISIMPIWPHQRQKGRSFLIGRQQQQPYLIDGTAVSLHYDLILLPIMKSMIYFIAIQEVQLSVWAQGGRGTAVRFSESVRARQGRLLAYKSHRQMPFGQNQEDEDSARAEEMVFLALEVWWLDLPIPFVHMLHMYLCIFIDFNHLLQPCWPCCKCDRCWAAYDVLCGFLGPLSVAKPATEPWPPVHYAVTYTTNTFLQ